MIDFQYARATDVADAVRMIAANPSAKFIAGGTNLIDLMKEDVERPTQLIDISRLPLKQVEETAEGGLRIGALVPNTDLAYHPLIERRYPVLSSAILAGASPQLRNMASTGGNLLQRTRCAYFYDTATPCNKRTPGSGCSAIKGLNRMHAILGTSDSCIAVHPSDMCVALAMLDAKVHVTGAGGARVIAFADFHRLPGDTPQRDTNLRPGRDRHRGRAARARLRGELHLSQDPRPPVLCVRAGIGRRRARARRRTIVRRASRSAASRTSRGATRQAEAALTGQPADRGHVQTGGGRAAGAMPKALAHNAFKIELARRAIVRGADPGRAWHAAIAIRQENPVVAMAPYIGTSISRVDGRAKGHRRGEICRRVQRPRTSPMPASCRRRSPRAASRASTRARPRASRACSTCSRTSTARAWQIPTRPIWTTSRPDGSPYRPLYDDKVLFRRQPVALVLAETSEVARFAASLVRVEYAAETHLTELDRDRDTAEALAL